MKNVVLLIALLCSACSYTPRVEPVHVDRTGVDVVTLPLGSSGITIRPSSSNEVVCALPASDSVATSGRSIGVGLTEATQGGDLSEGSERGALSLGGRDPAVLILREMMYRLCELSGNRGLSDEQMESYTKIFLDAAATMMKTQTGAGSAVLADNPEIKDLGSKLTSEGTSDDDGE